MNPNDNSTSDTQVPVAPAAQTPAPVTTPEPVPTTPQVEETVAAPEPMEGASQSVAAPVANANVSAPAVSPDPAAVLTEEPSDTQNG